MSIYRGAGGAGDAVADSSSEALLIRDLVVDAQADADAAAASASSASSSASAASASASAAAASAATIDVTSFVTKANNLSDLVSASTARTNLGLAIGTNVQAYDADLATIAGLTPTNNYVITGNGTAWTSAALPASGVTSVTGTSPIASSGGATPAISLTDSGVAANTYGSSSAIPVVTVNAKGLVTTVTTAAVAGGQYFGSAATKAIAYNANTISENVTVTAGNNGLSAGPITISSTYTVTVETGAVWVIV